MTTQALNALNISSSPGEESLAKKAWPSEQRYWPRWITRHKSGGVGRILQGRSWYGDRRREHA